MDRKKRKKMRIDYAGAVCEPVTARGVAFALLRGYAKLVKEGLGREGGFWAQLSKCEDIAEDAKQYGLVAPVIDGQRIPAKVSGVDLKRAFRTFIEQEYGSRCCYCQRKLQNIAHAKPIEHILPRVTLPLYELDFWNLAVSCYDCNHYKAAKDWTGGRFAGQRRYPLPRAFHDVFHARYHVYDDHVAYVRLQTNQASITYFIGKTPQGDQLCRDHLAEMARREMLWANNETTSDAHETIRAFGESEGREGREAFWAFFDQLNDISTRVP